MTVNADGSYTYAANQSGSMSLSDGATATDYFTYTVQDQSVEIRTLQTCNYTGSTNCSSGSNDTGVTATGLQTKLLLVAPQ